jgi:hypothetical protein
VKTLINAEKSLIMSLLLAFPPFFPPFSSPRLSLSLSVSFLTLFSPRLPHSPVSRLFRDANYVKYSHETRMPPQDHGLAAMPVDDSLNYSRRFPLRFHLRGFISLAVVRGGTRSARIEAQVRLFAKYIVKLDNLDVGIARSCDGFANDTRFRETRYIPPSIFRETARGLNKNDGILV